MALLVDAKCLKKNVRSVVVIVVAVANVVVVFKKTLKKKHKKKTRKQLMSCSSMSTCINVCGLQSIQHFWSSKLLNFDNDTLSDEQSRIPTSTFRKQLMKCCSTLKCASTSNLLLQYVIASLLDYFWQIIYALSVQNREFLQAPPGSS